VLHSNKIRRPRRRRRETRSTRRSNSEHTEEARHTPGPDIADEVGLAPSTVRNRLGHLAESGVIVGYHAHMDGERVDRRLTNLFTRPTSATERQELAQRTLDVPGVVDVREVMNGRGNLHIKAAGTDTDDTTRIAQDITDLGTRIDDEGLVHGEYSRPCAQFGPKREETTSPETGIAGLTGAADVVEFVVEENAPIARKRSKRRTKRTRSRRTSPSSGSTAARRVSPERKHGDSGGRFRDGSSPVGHR